MAKSVKYTVNFLEAKEGDLHRSVPTSLAGMPLWSCFAIFARVSWISVCCLCVIEG